MVHRLRDDCILISFLSLNFYENQKSFLLNNIVAWAPVDRSSRRRYPAIIISQALLYSAHWRNSGASKRYASAGGTGGPWSTP